MTSFEQTLRAMSDADFAALESGYEELDEAQRIAYWNEDERRKHVQDLREKYAGYAMMGMLANPKLTCPAMDAEPGVVYGEGVFAAMSKDACKIADALIKELGL